MIENTNTEIDIFEDDFGLLVAEGQVRDIADDIFERKGVYKMFDLKTISGNNSVDNRLSESVGQTNRVLLNMAVDYNPRQLARSIRHYFERNTESLEVLILKGKKIISIIREDVEGTSYIKYFMMKYRK